ncbi:MAG: DNA mismatch endonuclease Vsr [Ignavibacteriales bacterium]|nr:DNA mismatch endonuclease Vsr [Ignavibacteriales bacterium]
MTDTFNPEVRSLIMTSVRSSGNKSTEWKVRARLVAFGLSQWRMHDKTLPGSPDFVFPKRKLAVFIDGCFWHGCPKCYRRPKSSRAYWDLKVKKNMARDRYNRLRLRTMGWKVVRVWEHELKETPTLPFRLVKAIKLRS